MTIITPPVTVRKRIPLGFSYQFLLARFLARFARFISSAIFFRRSISAETSALILAISASLFGLPSSSMVNCPSLTRWIILGSVTSNLKPFGKIRACLKPGVDGGISIPINSGLFVSPLDTTNFMRVALTPNGGAEAPPTKNL